MLVLCGADFKGIPLVSVCEFDGLYFLCASSLKVGFTCW